MFTNFGDPVPNICGIPADLFIKILPVCVCNLPVRNSDVRFLIIHDCPVCPGLTEKISESPFDIIQLAADLTCHFAELNIQRVIGRKERHALGGLFEVFSTAHKPCPKEHGILCSGSCHIPHSECFSHFVPGMLIFKFGIPGDIVAEPALAFRNLILIFKIGKRAEAVIGFIAVIFPDTSKRHKHNVVFQALGGMVGGNSDYPVTGSGSHGIVRKLLCRLVVIRFVHHLAVKRHHAFAG